jgi:hypothetical protein
MGFVGGVWKIVDLFTYCNLSHYWGECADQCEGGEKEQEVLKTSCLHKFCF